MISDRARASTDKKADASIEQLLQGDDLEAQEISTVLDSRAHFPEFREKLWQTVSRNIDGLLARLDGDLDVALIQVADVFSSELLAREVEATITPLLGRLRGGKLQLALTLDEIRANSALINRLHRDALP